MLLKCTNYEPIKKRINVLCLSSSAGANRHDLSAAATRRLSEERGTYKLEEFRLLSQACLPLLALH